MTEDEAKALATEIAEAAGPDAVIGFRFKNGATTLGQFGAPSTTAPDSFAVIGRLPGEGDVVFWKKSDWEWSRAPAFRAYNAWKQEWESQHLSEQQPYGYLNNQLQKSSE